MKYNFCMECQAPLTATDGTEYVCTNGHYFWNNPKAAVAVAFLRDGKILYSKRGIEPNKGMYDLPGGFVDFGETAYQAAIREIKEELGIDIGQHQLQLTEVYDNLYNSLVSSIDIVFLVSNWHGEPQPLSETQELWWGPPEFIHDPQFCQAAYGTLDTHIARLTSSPPKNTVQ